jgi:hypothetical protein
MDWSTVVILAFVTWLDGMRRVPDGALVLRRALIGRWIVDERSNDDSSFRLVAWWSPFSLALTIPVGGVPDADASNALTEEALDARLKRVRGVVGVLRLLGGLIIVGIVIGFVAAVARFGAWGFVAVLGAVLFLTWTVFFVTMCAMRASGRRWRRAARIAAPLLWPFTAPRAAELILERAIAGAPPLLVARRLLGAASFAVWVRPQAYDTLRGNAGPADSASLLALVGRPDLAAIVHSTPTQCATGERYCPRCGRVYRATIASCAECEGLHLVSAA